MTGPSAPPLARTSGYDVDKPNYNNDRSFGNTGRSTESGVWRNDRRWAFDAGPHLLGCHIPYRSLRLLGTLDTAAALGRP